jgi:hypothetical protein
MLSKEGWSLYGKNNQPMLLSKGRETALGLLFPPLPNPRPKPTLIKPPMLKTQAQQRFQPQPWSRPMFPTEVPRVFAIQTKLYSLSIPGRHPTLPDQNHHYAAHATRDTSQHPPEESTGTASLVHLNANSTGWGWPNTTTRRTTPDERHAMEPQPLTEVVTDHITHHQDSSEFPTSQVDQMNAAAMDGARTFDTLGNAGRQAGTFTGDPADGTNLLKLLIERCEDPKTRMRPCRHLTQRHSNPNTSTPQSPPGSRAKRATRSSAVPMPRP